MAIGSSDRASLLKTVHSLCPDVAPDILNDFFTRMDPEYFQRFKPPTIGEHVRLTARLTPDHPCEIVFTEQPDKRVEVTIVAYDYFSEFATICGLLSAFGLNIEEGDIYTFAEHTVPSSGRASWTGYGPRVRTIGTPGLSRKKIVDVFRVFPVSGAGLGTAQQDHLTASLA
jgi:[glutamine synthetase] adenylyltransferase / [glutamine synthetase]-adenylyl-L-tyrosine phosphorylase